MSIIRLQARDRELGRIRLGAKAVSRKTNKPYPVKLDKWRLTSKDRRLLENAAQLYGGEVKEWEKSDTEREWELYTEVDELPVMLSPMAMTQHMEMWSGGGCVRRCDGEFESISGSNCLCTIESAEEGEEQCKPHTRLPLFLYELPDLGVWRLETQGWNAAAELGRSVEILKMLSTRGVLPSGILALEHRKSLREGKTLKYAVPIIKIQQSIQELMTGTAPALKDGPASLPSPQQASIDAQAPAKQVITQPPAPVSAPANQQKASEPTSGKLGPERAFEWLKSIEMDDVDIQEVFKSFKDMQVDDPWPLLSKLEQAHYEAPAEVLKQVRNLRERKLKEQNGTSNP